MNFFKILGNLVLRRIIDIQVFRCILLDFILSRFVINSYLLFDFYRMIKDGLGIDFNYRLLFSWKLYLIYRFKLEIKFIFFYCKR